MTARAIYFEITRIGGYAKAVAIDSETGIEAAVLAPQHANDTDLQILASAKLERALDKYFHNNIEDAAKPSRKPGIEI